MRRASVGESTSALPGAEQHAPACALRELSNSHGWPIQAQAHCPASSGACNTNKRVNLIRSRSGSATLSHTAHRLRAVRRAQRGEG
jgi:hypothetical protein